MIARFVLRDFWSAGEAPTLGEFSKQWLLASAAHTRPRPEGAYLADRHRGQAGQDWKQVRIAKARQALEVLSELVAAHASRGS